MDSAITRVRSDLGLRGIEDEVTSPRQDLPDEFIEPPTTLWNPTPGDDWLEMTIPRTHRPVRARGSTAPPMTRERLASLARTTPVDPRPAQPFGPIAPTVVSADLGRRSPVGSEPQLALVERTQLAVEAVPPAQELPSASQLRVGDSTSLLRPGFSLGNYVIRRQLAKGGMGVVYEAEHRYLRRRVAVKVLRQSRLKKPEVVRRFFREAVAATQIGHAGVVEVIDYGHIPDGGAYLVMELLSGESLGERLDVRHQLTVHEALDIGRAIADIMAAAHAAGIVHRDLKPDNVFLTRGEDGAQLEGVKVLDFGVAKFLQSFDGQKTKYGKLLGTPYYMSPEQCEGSGEVDHRSDVYSLGCLLFEMLTGRCPFVGHTVDVLLAHRRQAPPSVRSFNNTVPPEIDALIQQMLAKRPEQRPQSMAQVVAELTIAGRSHSGSIDAPIDFARGSTAPEPDQLVRIPRYGPTVDRARKRRSLWATLLIVTAGLVLTAAAATTAYLTVSNGQLPF